MNIKNRSYNKGQSEPVSQKLGIAGNAYRIRHAASAQGRQSIDTPYFASLYYLYKNPNPILAVRAIPLREIQAVSDGTEKTVRKPLQILHRALERVRHAREALEVWPRELVERFQTRIAQTLTPQILRDGAAPAEWLKSENQALIVKTVMEQTRALRDKGDACLCIADMLEENPMIQPLSPLPPDRKEAILPEYILLETPTGCIPAKEISARLLERIGTTFPLQTTDPQRARDDVFFLLRRIIRHKYTPIGCAQIGPMNMVRVNHYYPAPTVDAILRDGEIYREILASTISEKAMAALLEASEPELWWMIGRLRRLSPSRYERLLVFHDGIFVGLRYDPRSICQLRNQFRQELRQIYTLDGARQAAGFKSAPAFHRALQALIRHGRNDLGDHILPYSPTIVIIGGEIVNLLRALGPRGAQAKAPAAELVRLAYQELETQKHLSQALRGLPQQAS